MSIMIMSESTISILMPWYSLVLEVKKILKTLIHPLISDSETHILQISLQGMLAHEALLSPQL